VRCLESYIHLFNFKTTKKMNIVLSRDYHQIMPTIGVEYLSDN
jgi:hypothetical protein